MIFLVVIAAALVVAWLRQGTLVNLALVRIRWSGLILAGFLIQLLVFQPFWQNRAETRALTVIAYAVSMGMLLLAVLANLRLPGLWIIMLGFFCNAAAIGLNGGHMPASPEALALAGLPALSPGQTYNNSMGARLDTAVWFLTDIFAIPRQFPFHNVFSIGDILLAIGAFYFIQKVMVKPREQPAASGPGGAANGN